ncbi:Transcriptional regulator ADR1 [Lasiodiplodia hormozganensis]|uniref:Transcriptional regulator ADR1 n=1 Tax=Lasiodiplodia hormozganensis TaxID=869390 RepID=A0AA39WG87_9PEZI|nr:Transcriptional regulator ADR1 [Lasiodiplodia hormozganensis]
MSGKQRRVYKCTTCARVFKRSEHCSRHERIHTRERPFACQYCHKKYARKDLVTRHEKTLHSEKRRQSIATAVPDSPDSRRSSESTETINVSIPSNASSQPDLRQSFEPETEAPPHVALAENFAPMATSAELSPHQLAVTDDRRSSQILVPTDVMSPSFAFGSAVEALYPSPQSCPEQAPGSLQPWGEPIVAFQEVPMQAPFMPIDPQLCGPQQSLDLDLMSPRHSRGSKAAVPSIESRNDSMDAAQETMSPPTKRRRLTTRGSHSIDTHRASQHDWHHDLDSSSIDIFRDFWSPPEPPSNMAQNHMDSLITPESLEFSIPIDPFLTGGQDQHSASLFDSSFSFKGPSMNSSVLSRKSFPEESKESNSDQAKLAVGPEIYCSIRADLQARTRKEDWDDSKLPNAKELQKFIEGYINCFHRHFPVVHFHSMNLESTPSPLILAICCIGALYRLDRRRAAVLYELASPLLHSAISASRKVNSSSPGPLWAVQGSLLLAMYSVFSGRTALVLSSIERSGFFVSEYRIRRTCSAAEFSRGNSTWEDWVSEESGKRVLCGILILSNLISVAYGTSPWFSVGEDLQVELPAKDGLWDAKTAAQWTEAKSKAQEGSRQTVKEAMLDTLSQDQPDGTPEDDQTAWGFAGLVIAHAANIHVWHLSQISQCPGGNNKSALLLDAASSIEKCQHALNHGRGGNGCSEDYRHPHHAAPPSDDAQTTSSLVSNTNALLRIASTRLFGVGAAAPAFNRFALASDSDRVVSAAVDAYLRAPMDDDRNSSNGGGKSNDFATKGARQACEGFMLPAKVGSPLLVRKTAAFGWSVEHAVAWWDASLFLSKWVHAAQQRERASAGLEEEERAILKDVKACLGELEVDFDAATEGASLAAAVARACAAFLSDTWVWGVTPRMGSVLMKLADAYEKDFKEAVEC